MRFNILIAPILILFSFTTYAQWGNINSFTVIPSNPTMSDTILILAHNSFSSGDCMPYSESLNQNGNLFTGNAYHCLGPLTVICNYTDSFRLMPQPAGLYKFVFNLYTGGGAPCNQNLADKDSVSFFVSSTTPVVNPEFGGYNPQCFYRQGILYMTGLSGSPTEFQIRIINQEGRLVLSRTGNLLSQIPLNLAPGLYSLILESRNDRKILRFLAY